MKQLTEAQLRQLLIEAWDQGFSTAQEKGVAYDPAEIDIEQDEYLDKVLESI